MGGYGSGGFNRQKDDLSSYKGLDIRVIQKSGMLKNRANGIYRWETGGEKSGSVGCYYDGKHSIILSYFVAGNKGEIISQNIELIWTKTGFGQRAWFECPLCGRNTAVLYYKNASFGCRTCQKLNYRSSQRSGDIFYMIDNKIYKIIAKLKAHRSSDWTRHIKKPKEMHEKTYIKLNNRLHELGQLTEAVFISEVKRRFGNL